MTKGQELYHEVQGTVAQFEFISVLYPTYMNNEVKHIKKNTSFLLWCKNSYVVRSNQMKAFLVARPNNFPPFFTLTQLCHPLLNLQCMNLWVIPSSRVCRILDFWKVFTKGWKSPRGSPQALANVAEVHPLACIKVSLWGRTLGLDMLW